MSNPMRNPLILVVDDQASQRMLAAESLLLGDFDVIEAICGEDALAVFAAGEFDAVLLDVMMPGMDGFEVCERIRRIEKGTHTPVMMVTARDDDAAIDRAYLAGATDFIAKPINPIILRNRMRYMLRSAQDAKALRELAYFDTLTSLPNRALVTERLAQLLEPQEKPSANRAQRVKSLQRVESPQRIKSPQGKHSE